MKKGITLIETLIGIVLLSVIVAGVFHIEYFARAQVIYADRRAKLHNEAMILLEHMSKNLALTIGNLTIDGINGGVNSVYDTNGINGDVGIIARIDGPSGSRDGKRGAGDYNIGYRWRDAGAPIAQRYQVWFYPAYVAAGNHGGAEVLVTNVKSLSFATDVNNNYIDVNATLCFDARNNLDTCGTASNPEEDISATIVLPMVSVK